jgi:SulP family sulfate permease
VAEPWARVTHRDERRARRQGGGGSWVHTIRFDRFELAGSVADVGLMVPLACGVAVASGTNLAVIFACVAASYAVTALSFRAPVPVQPMKVMAATVIAQRLSATVVGVAGVEIGLLFLVLALTPAMRALARLFPAAVIRGIQLAIGLLLIKAAIRMADTPKALPGTAGGIHVGGGTVWAGVALACVIALIMLIHRGRGRVPLGLLTLAAGAVAGLVALALGVGHMVSVPAASAKAIVHLPSAGDAWLAFVVLVLPQLPLSMGNAVYATEDAMKHYFGDQAARVTPRNLGVSMGLIDLVCGALSGMPLCHGSSGATAAYRFGGRTAGTTLLAAALYALLAVGVLLHASPLVVPSAVLAGLLLFVGVQHSLLVADLRSLDAVASAAVIGGATLVTGNMTIGFLLGWACYAALQRTPLRRVPVRWPRLTAWLAPRPAVVTPGLAVSATAVTPLAPAGGNPQ